MHGLKHCACNSSHAPSLPLCMCSNANIEETMICLDEGRHRNGGRAPRTGATVVSEVFGSSGMQILRLMGLCLSAFSAAS